MSDHPGPPISAVTTYRDGLAGLRRRRAAGVPCDRQEIDRRFVDLRGATFDDAEVFRAFADVFDAVCAPEHTIFRPIRDQCRLDTGREVVAMAGEIIAAVSGDPVAVIARELDFRSALVHHAKLIVRPEFRGLGLAAVFVHHSLAFYETLALREVRLTAGLTAGPYYWAKLGFQFVDAAESEKVRHWAARVNAKLGTGLDCTRSRSPYGWAQLGIDEGACVSLAEVRQHFPDRREQIVMRADDLGVALDDELHFGKAVLLSGPSWCGRLPVRRSSLTLLESYVTGKAEAAGRALTGKATPGNGMQSA